MISSIEQIYQELAGSTASGRGVSYWEEASNCGRKRNLIQLHQDIAKAAETYVEEKKLGTLYHGLLQMYRAGRLPDGLVLDVGPVQSQEWAEALRLFRFHREWFPRDYFGEVVATELKLPTSDDHKAKIAAHFGHDEITGAVDLVVTMSAADVARLEQERGVQLDGPGLYFVDYKTSGARKSAEAAVANYTASMQAMTYPLLWNLAGGEPCKGMLYDVIVKHEELRRHDVNSKKLASVQTFFARAQPEHANIVKAAINGARQARDDNKANPYACFSNSRACPFMGSLCGRY